MRCAGELRHALLGSIQHKYADTSDQGQSLSAYHLYAVLVHSGSGVSSGHYFAYVQDDGGWWRVDDSSATRCRADEALKAQAYIAFYAQAGGSATRQSSAVGGTAQARVSSPSPASIATGVSPSADERIRMLRGTRSIARAVPAGAAAAAAAAYRAAPVVSKPLTPPHAGAASMAEWLPPISASQGRRASPSLRRSSIAAEARMRIQERQRAAERKNCERRVGRTSSSTPPWLVSACSQPPGQRARPPSARRYSSSSGLLNHSKAETAPAALRAPFY